MRGIWPRCAGRLKPDSRSFAARARLLRGSLGFGGALGLPLLALVIPVKILAPAWSLAGIVSAAIVGRGRKHVAQREFLGLLLGCALGVAKELLEVYGFEDITVTRLSKDGGIDGYGKLKVGLSHLNVAFQCKRWASGNIQRPEIDAFRGAAQGDFEQAISFATTSFSQGAIDASIKRGAVPVVLIDASAIFKLMVEKGFGIEAESFAIPTYNLDGALTPENTGGESVTVESRPRLGK